MKTSTFVIAALMIVVLSGCSQAVRTVDIDAPGYSDKHLTGYELLKAAQDHALAELSSVTQLKIRIELAELGDPTTQSLYNRADVLREQVLDCIELGSVYRNPRYSSDAEQRQIYRAIVDRLKNIQKKRLEIASETHPVAQPQSQS